VTTIAFDSRRGRLVLAAAITASGVAFLDGSVVNVALPKIGADLGGGFATLQWVVDAYLLTLGSLVLVGGALGDLLGRRRVFHAGILGFGGASLLCAVAPSATVLALSRGVQGVAAALLVPGSLSLMSSLFEGADRGRAIGAWSGLSGVFFALGPFVGGFLVALAPWGWRLVFLVNLPIVTVAVLLSRASVPDLPGTRGGARLDLAGAVLVTLGLGLVVYPLIEWDRLGRSWALPLLVVGVVLLLVFLVVERRAPMPMMPLALFRIRTFSVANVVTFVVYAALGSASFLVVVTLQEAMGYSAFASGAALLPVTASLLLLSSRVGGLVPIVGGRLLLTTGGLVTGLGMLLFLRVEPGSTYVGGVLPAVLVFALGLALVVAPVTTTVLGDVGPARSGVASGVNNAVARVGSLVAVAVLPLVSGLSSASTDDPEALIAGFHTAMVASAGLCVLGGLVALLGLPGARPGRSPGTVASEA
jgi:EmrB/QacA subfamily drug resistance transporter